MEANPDPMSTNKVILGLLGGLAAGAALGVLFAPQSGKKTRQYLMRRGKRAKDDVGEMIEHGREEWIKARNKASDMASMTRDEVEDFVRYLFEQEGRSTRTPENDLATTHGAHRNGKRTEEAGRTR
jgi:gas vesicle protein